MLYSRILGLGLTAAALVGFLAAPPLASAAVPLYTITDLGAAPPSYPSGNARAVNAVGFSAGNVFNATNSISRAFFYDVGLHDLGTLKTDNSGNAYASSLNDTGFVVGQADTNSGVPHPFLYAGGMLDITPSAGVGAANAISRYSQVTGLTTNSGGILQAFFYDYPSNAMTLLGSPNFKSEGLGIIDDGKIAGYTLDSSSNQQAFVTDSYGQTQISLGTLGGSQSQATALNVSNQITGSADVVGDAIHAFRTPGGVPLNLVAADDLGVLPGGVSSQAFGINVVGQVVGYSEITGHVHHAFVYSPGLSAKILDLNALIPAGSGWVLTQANGINDTGTVVGSGSYKGTVHAFQLVPNTLVGLTLSPRQVYGSLSTTGTALLRDPSSGSSSSVVALHSSNPLVTVPATVSVAQGQVNVIFPVSASVVAKTTTVTITATYKGGIATTSLTILPTVPLSVSFSPNLVPSGGAITGTVTLSGPAPAGGTTVSLTSSTALLAVPSTVSSIALLAVPSTVTVPAGATEALFTATAAVVVAAPTTAMVTAKIGLVSTTTTVKVTPISLNGFMLSPNLVDGGRGTTATVTLTDPAPAGGLTIPLTTSDNTVTIPASLSIPAGGTEASFAVATPTTNVEKTVQLTATYNGPVTTFLDIKPTVVPTTSPATMYASPAYLGSGGQTSLGTVTVNFAPHGNYYGGGTTVTLTSSNPALASVPASLTFLSDGSQGGTPGPTQTFTITTGGYVTQATPVTITATWSDPGGSGSASATVTLQPAVPAAISVASGTVSGGGQNSVGTVTIASAPGGNYYGGNTTVTLTSSNPALASVPASLTFLSDGSQGGTPGPTQTFPITTSYVAVPTKVTLTAKVGTVSKSTTITLLPIGPVTLSVASPAILGGSQNSVGTVTMASAPSGNYYGGGITVTLVSSNPAVAGVPASVNLFGDGSQGGTPGPAQTFPITTAYVTQPTPVTITATAAIGKVKTVTRTTVTVLPNVPSRLTLASVGVTSGQTTIGTLTVSGVPSGNYYGGGITVTLTSSNPAVASVPASVNLFGDGNQGGTPGPTQTFSIQAGSVTAPTPVTITATLGSGMGAVHVISQTLTVYPAP